MKGSYHQSPFNRGLVKNFETALGSNPFLWFIPFFPPEGDGVHFITEDTPLTSVVADNRGGNGNGLRSRPP